jgi:hypothetical protein
MQTASEARGRLQEPINRHPIKVTIIIGLRPRQNQVTLGESHPIGEPSTRPERQSSKSGNRKSRFLTAASRRFGMTSFFSNDSTNDINIYDYGWGQRM